MPILLQLSSSAARLIAGVLLCCGVLSSPVVYCQGTEKVIEVNLAAQPMESALRSIADRYGMQILFNPNEVKGLMAPAVSGRYSATQLLEKIVEGTGLTAVHDGKNAIAVKPRVTTRVERTSAVKEQPLTVTMPQIMVQGSKVLSVDIKRTPNDPQPWVVFDRSIIEQSGAMNLEDLFKQRLSMNAVGLTDAQRNTFMGNNSSVSLRGLGPNQTLILVDGRRLGSGPTFSGSPRQPGLNAIPLAAIERIEILPTTASGIYGGGATGGVVNIILRRDYTGVEVRAAYENTVYNDRANPHVDLAAGFALEGGRTNVLLAASWSDAGMLRVGDRDFVQRGRAAIFSNNPSFFNSAANPPTGTSSNIRSVDGSSLVLDNGTALGSSITHVPLGYAGVSSDNGAALAAAAGRYNLDLPDSAQPGGGRRLALLSAPETESLTATVRRSFSPSLDGFLDVTASNNSSSFAIASSTASTFTLAANATNNPFRQAIRVTVPSASADSFNTTKVEDRRAVAGVIARLPGEWRAEADYSVSSSRIKWSTPGSLTAAGTAAVTSGAIDVIRDTTVNPVDFSPFLNPPVSSDQRVSFYNASLRLAGPVGSLPGGPVSLSSLLEYRSEQFDESTQFNSPTSSLLYPEMAQQIASAYVELTAPVLRTLDVQLALRHDRYKIDGATPFVFLPLTTPIVRTTNESNSTNPTLALRYKPFADVALRASYGTGFLPPSVVQLAPSAPITIPTTTATDPRRGNTQLGSFQFAGGGNPELRPEESKSWSAGVVVTPRFIPDLRLSIDWTRIAKTDIITTPSTQLLIDNEAAFPGRVIRGSNLPGDPAGWPGPITGVVQSAINLSRAWIEAYDLQLDYRLPTQSWGTFDFLALATLQTHYTTQLFQTFPRVENVGVTSSNPLKFKANLAVTWTREPWVIGWVGRYFDSYAVADETLTSAPAIIANQGSRRVPSQTYHDLFATYRIMAKGLLADTEVTLGLRNVFNKRPPFDAGTANYFYSPLGDPRLANYYLAVRKQF